METVSLCPECYASIPAVIYERDGAAWMTKVCLEHGTFDAMVERDYGWWLYSQTHAGKGIYDGYIVDATTRCNLNCHHCFHSKGGADRSIPDIALELRSRSLPGDAPVILFGGEPTIHSEFFQLAREIRDEFGLLSMVTNGTMTADPSFFEKALPFFMLRGRDTTINVSTHKESNGADIATLENARDAGVTIYSVLYLVDDIGQVEHAVKLADRYSDVVQNVRIRAAGNIWAESEDPDRLFVSDIIKELARLGRVELIAGAKHVTGFANIKFNGNLHLIPAAFPDVFRVDLQEIDCAPWYRAKDGSVNNILTSLLINEGIDKGFYQGRPV